jgi:transglutaminase-like putative cysteine protease
MSVVEAIRRANQPRPPEESVRLRVACTCTVGTAVATCASLGEVSWTTALGALVLIVVGMAFSYRTRVRPPGWIKLLVAAGAIAACVFFFHSVTTSGQGVTGVEDPLTALLVSVLVVHSFHVPARRDLLFAVAASAGLMAVGAAQAIDLGFGLYVVAWMCFGIWSLMEMWLSASGGGRMSMTGIIAALVGMTAATGAVFFVLPAPAVAVRFDFLAHAGAGGVIPVPGALAGDGSAPGQLARAGTPGGPTRIGGYLGFAKALDTALRGSLSQQLVMMVRAQRPSYWVGETFDHWNGRSWTSTTPAARPVRESSPIVLPVPEGNVPLGPSDLQTFYVLGSTADLVFHAESANQLWFPAPKVYVADNGTMVSPIGLGKGAIYTVNSVVSAPTPDELRHAAGGLSLPPASEAAYLQLPHPYTRAHALAARVTSKAPDTYDKVQALITWIGAHTRYSLDIPPLPAGADTVNEFLFGNRVGFCEQISTSLTVMLRSLGIPAREAVGYVPGSYNPVTDLYEIRADDAHAWVQVWFPHFGWQSFDPTAVVAPENPSPGIVALHDIGHALRQVPPLPTGVAVGAAALVALGLRWRRRRPATWAERVARSAERAGRHVGLRRLPSQTLIEYAAVVDARRGGSGWAPLARAVEASAYGGRNRSLSQQRQMVTAARRLRHRRNRGRG